MNEILSRFETGELIGLVAVVGAFLCGFLGISLGFYHQWHETRRKELVMALKQDMLNRGMTPEQIQVVLEAGSSGLGRRSCRV